MRMPSALLAGKKPRLWPARPRNDLPAFRSRSRLGPIRPWPYRPAATSRYLALRARHSYPVSKHALRSDSGGKLSGFTGTIDDRVGARHILVLKPRALRPEHAPPPWPRAIRSAKIRHRRLGTVNRLGHSPRPRRGGNDEMTIRSPLRQIADKLRFVQQPPRCRWPSPPPWNWASHRAVRPTASDQTRSSTSPARRLPDVLAHLRAHKHESGLRGLYIGIAALHMLPPHTQRLEN